MQRLLIILIIITFKLICFSQTENKSSLDSISADYEMTTYIETPPKFPGGVDSLWCFIESNFDFNFLNNSNHQGKVLTFFEIDTSGKVINVQTNPEYTHRHEWIVNDSLIEMEIKRVIGLLPDWEPGLQRNKPVGVKYILPIMIPYTKYRCKTNDHFR